MTEIQESLARPDPEALRRLLDGEHAWVRDRVREVLARAEFRPQQDLTRDEYRQQVLTWARTLAKEGGTLIGYPKEFGGTGDVGAGIAAFETLAYGDLSLLVKCGVQVGLFGGAVLQLGTRKHQERYLRDIGMFELPGCFAMTEAGHGSDVQELRTTATYDAPAGEFVVHTPDDAARKDFIGSAARDGRMAVVFAQLVVDGTEHGVHALLVPIRDAAGRPAEGVRIADCGEKMGLNGVDNGELWFDHVRVPRDALLDRYARVGAEGEYSSPIENPRRRFFTMIGTLIQGRASVGGAALSATKSALTIAVRYALTRRQFGRPGGGEVPLLDYRTHQRRLLPALATTYALHFAQQRLAAEAGRAFGGGEYPEHDRRKLETEVSGVKAAATWHATETIQACREACGGVGYMAVNRFAALKADTDVFTTFEGDNTVLMQLVAKSLLTDYRDQFGELDPLGMAGFLAGQVAGALAERTAAREILGRLRDDLVPSREGDTDLLDRDYLLGLFRWREQHVIAGAARRLKRGVDRGDDPFQTFLDCQDHVVATAHAHIDRIVLEAFVGTVEGCADNCTDSVLAPVLGRLCDLYALSKVERDRGWFQEHGRISSTRSKMVTRTVNRLCAELRPHAAALVDAFGIPDAVLAAPIGVRGDGRGGP
ncbi:MAG: acyl-CoA dehydrogenase [Streptosporangiaceae bacterium]